MAAKKVLAIGFDPNLLDFSSPELAPMQLNAEKVMMGLNADQDRLKKLGYDSDLCLVDLGETAEKTVSNILNAKKYDCVLIGAGVRTNPKFFLLFEKLINVVHAEAPQAKICFNTKPADTAESIQRWV
ncbi:hypothetical protein [Bdellovibrio sp. HCB337]|uniref:hypothetical protein n=1 Tax=Bdellovibrio sp. HCB337 TaxID=3394358 RepID=UPI0039A49F32